MRVDKTMMIYVDHRMSGYILRVEFLVDELHSQIE